jgi:hypothetical protein
MIYLVDPSYNPNFVDEITNTTILAPGISVAKFLGARGSRNQFERVSADKAQIARNLYLHAELIKKTSANSEFDDYRLVVSEGIYVPAIDETVSGDSINDYRQTGKAIVYQLIGTNGKVDFSKTYDLAVYWKDYCDYDKLILDYDTYDPSGQASSQIVVIMPTVPTSFDITFQGRIETRFNTNLQSANELVEILL